MIDGDGRRSCEHPSTGSPGEITAAEIAEQPEVFAGLIENSAEILDTAARIAARPPRFVLIAARGTSDHAGLYAKYLVEILLQIPAGLASLSTFTLYGAKPDLRDVLFLAVSQSGHSPDLVRSTQTARACGALTLAVTNDPGSPLAAAAEIALDVRAGAERAVAATKSYTAELLTLALLLHGETAREAARRLPQAAAQTLELAQSEPMQSAVMRFRYAERLITCGRGYSYPTAREAALKLMETCYVSAQAFSGADLMHGPMAMVDRRIPVVAVTGTASSAAALAPVVDQLQRSGADVLAVGPRGDLPVCCSGVSDYLLPILEILPLQTLALQLALTRGGDPDRPRGLSKVTETL